jgi:hypothetical protein
MSQHHLGNVGALLVQALGDEHPRPTDSQREGAQALGGKHPRGPRGDGDGAKRLDSSRARIHAPGKLEAGHHETIDGHHRECGQRDPRRLFEVIHAEVEMVPHVGKAVIRSNPKHGKKACDERH